MNRTVVRLLALSSLLSLPFTVPTFAEVVSRKMADAIDGLTRSTTRGSSVVFNVNTISTYIRNNGSLNRNPTTANAGFEWPRGSGKTASYASGLWLGGKRGGTIRASVAEYSCEFEAGPIRAGVNPQDSVWRVYRIRKGDNAALNGDYASWPYREGAPYRVTSAGDTVPQLIGDMTVWTVFNDNNDSLHTNIRSLPLGIEVQVTSFGYDLPNALGNTIFHKYTIINKGGTLLDSVFFSIWSDDDLGDSGDDYVGCDSALGLGFTYNALPYDVVYGIRPPAVGFAVVQGPLVPGTATDTARFPDGRVLPGKKLLKMTSFIKYVSDSSPLGNPQNANNVFNYQKGRDRTGSEIRDPYNNPTTFMLSGDPNLPAGNSNWIETSAGGDRHYIMSSGPFTMAANDTQVIVVANSIARGMDNRNSVTELKRAARFVKQSYQANLPTLPSLTSTVSYPTATTATVAIVVEASSLGVDSIVTRLKRVDESSVADVRLFDDGAHGDGGASDGIFGNSVTVGREVRPMHLDLTLRDSLHQVFTWDRFAHSITTIGPVEVTLPVIFSDNLNSDGVVNPGENVRFGFTLQNSTPISLNGLTLSPEATSSTQPLHIDRLDPGQMLSFSYNSNDPRSYFNFNVSRAYTDTSYAFRMDLVDTLENAWSFTFQFTVIQLPGPVYGSPVTHAAGESEWQFRVQVVDTFAVKSHQYEITIVDSIDEAGTKGLTLVDLTEGRTVLSKHHFPDSLGHTIPLTDGFKLLPGENFGKVGLRADSSHWIPSARIWLQGVRFSYGIPPEVFAPGPAVPGYQLSEYLGQLHPIFDSTDLIPVEIRFDSTHTQNAYRLRRAGGIGTSYVIQAIDPFVPVPFTVWDLSSSPQRQLTVSWRDQNDNGRWDPPVGGYDDGFEIVFVYSRSYDAAGHQWPYQDEGPDSSTWSNACTVGKDADIVYGLSVGVRDAHLMNESFLGLYLRPWRSAHEGDRFTFNPSVGKPSPLIPTAYKLEQNYPNPFNLGTTILFDLPFQEMVRLKVYNVLGQEVVTLVNDVLPAGTHVRQWSGQNNQSRSVASGVYFYRLESGGYSSVKKMLLLK